jgi:triosephosphate isomerase
MEQTRSLVVNTLNKLDFHHDKVDVIVAPILLHVPWVLHNLNQKVKVSAQNSSDKDFGAFTGEVSAKHLLDFGLEWVILGHSERR